MSPTSFFSFSFLMSLLNVCQITQAETVEFIQWKSEQCWTLKVHMSGHQSLWPRSQKCCDIFVIFDQKPSSKSYSHMYTLYIMHVTYASTSTIQAYSPCINSTTATMHALYAYVTCVNRTMHVCNQCHTLNCLKSHFLSSLWISPFTKGSHPSIHSVPKDSLQQMY